MGKIAALKPSLTALKPKVAFLRESEADIDRRRAQTNEARGNYKTVRWRRLRWQVLREALFTCARCGANRGDDTSQLVADHIRPHRGDEALFWDRANLQCLCKPCHDGAKQSEERRGQPRKFRFSVPSGVLPSAIPVTLVCGPPAAGKTTWINERAADGDLIIDFDVYRARAGGVKWDADPAVMRQAYLWRDADIKSLALRAEGRAWLIAMAPTKAERRAWKEALGPQLRIVMLATPASECCARVLRDPTRAAAAAKMIEAIGKWWHEYDG